MTNLELKKEIRKEIKSLGYSAKDFSVTGGVYEINIKAKKENLTIEDFKKVELATEKYTKEYRNEWGELLLGGGTYIFVINQQSQTRTWN